MQFLDHELYANIIYWSGKHTLILSLSQLVSDSYVVPKFIDNNYSTCIYMYSHPHIITTHIPYSGYTVRGPNLYEWMRAVAGLQILILYGYSAAVHLIINFSSVIDLHVPQFRSMLVTTNTKQDSKYPCRHGILWSSLWS